MQYKNTNIDGFYKLVKYQDDMENADSILENLKEEFLDSIVRMPYIYSDISEDQAYLVMDKNKKCYGGVVILSPTFEKLEIGVDIHENYEKIVHLLMDFIGRNNEDKKYMDLVVSKEKDVSFLLDNYRHKETLSFNDQEYDYIFYNRFYHKSKNLLKK